MSSAGVRKVYLVRRLRDDRQADRPLRASLRDAATDSPHRGNGTARPGARCFCASCSCKAICPPRFTLITGIRGCISLFLRRYQPVMCLTCAQMRFVNSKTGQVLGAEGE